MRITRLGHAVLVGLGLTQAAGAAAQGADKPVIEKLQHGEINWTEKTVVATGSGAPDLKLPNVAAIRLNAERAAKLNAYRNILETLKGMRVSADKTGKQALAEGQVRTQVEGIVRGCKVADTRYYSDGGVDVVLQCPLDGGLATSIAPVRDQQTVKSSGEAKFSGLVVDATGLSAKPSLQPRIVDAGGEEIYAVTMVSPNELRKHGAAVFVRSVEAAKQVARVGDKPLVLKAKRLGQAASELVVSKKDVAAMKDASHTFLAEARVVIVTDAP